MDKGTEELNRINIRITRLSYSYSIKCKNCEVWQDFSSSLPKHDIVLRMRIQRWTCRLCSYDNTVTYELGLNNIQDE